MSILHFPVSSAPPSLEDPLSALPDAEALADACLDEESERESIVAALSGLGAPLVDMIASPMAARASLLGAAEGRAFVHHELRERVPMTTELEPEVAVWSEGTTPVWRNGILTEPKYFSFFQDAPLPVFNPNHRGKWRAHEMLHGANGFFWNPEMTRFSFYLGCRVNELLPVVLWYAFDEAYRARCPEHHGQRPTRGLCPVCEALERPFWDHSSQWRESQRTLSAAHFRSGLDHFNQEWRACLRELGTGRRVTTPFLHLDASSDAVGYLRGHWNRTTAWSFGGWVERFLVEGVDYHADLRAYMTHATEVLTRLLCGNIAIDPLRTRRLRARRVLQDVAYRILLFLEHLPEGSEMTPVNNALEDAATYSRELLDNEDVSCDALWPNVHRMLESLGMLRTRNKVSMELVRAVPCTGYTSPAILEIGSEPSEPWSRPAAHFLAQGLANACPESTASFHDLESEAVAFGASRVFDGPNTLATRFHAWLVDQNVDVATTELAEFEAWISAPPASDHEAETFASIPPDVATLLGNRSRLRANTTIRRMEGSARLADSLLGADSKGPVHLIGARYDGSPRILIASEHIEAILEHIERESRPAVWMKDEWIDTVLELIDHGIVVWEPLP